MDDLKSKIQLAKEKGAAPEDVYKLMHTEDQLKQAQDVFGQPAEEEEDLFAELDTTETAGEEDLFAELDTTGEEDLFADAGTAEASARPDVVSSDVGFAANLEDPMTLMRKQSIPAHIVKWLSTSDTEYAKIRKDERESKIRENPYLSELNRQLNLFEEVQLERDLSPEEEDRMWQMRDEYANASAQIAEAVDKDEEEGSVSWDGIVQAAKADPGGFAANFVNAIVADPELVFAPQMAAARATTALGKATYATVTGAALAASDEFVREMGETGKYNASDIKAVAALGGITNGILAAGAPILGAIKRARATKEPVTPEMAQGILDDYKIVDATGEDLASIINRRAGIAEAEKSADFYVRQRAEVRKAFKEDPEVVEQANFYERIVKDAEELKATKTPAQRKAEAEAKIIEESIVPAVETTAETIERTAGVLPAKGAKARLKEREADFRAAVKDDPEMAQFFKRHAEDMHQMRELDTVLTKKAEIEAEGAKTTEVDKAWSTYQADALTAKFKQMEEAWATQDVPTVQKVENALTAAKVERRFANQTESGVDALDNRIPTTNMEHAFQKSLAENRRMVRRLNKQAGEVDPKLMMYLAGASAGGLIGYSALSSRPEDVVAGALVGVALPWMFSRRPLPLKRIKDWSNDENALLFGSSDYITHPAAMMRSYGDSGQTLAHMIDKMHWNVDQKIAYKLKDVRDTFGHLSSEQKAQVIAIMQKRVDAKNFDPEVQNTAKLINKDLDSVLDEAHAVGLYTKDQVAALRQNVKDKGYWPRVYDEVLLNSTKGEEMWVKAFAKTWNEQKLTDVLEGLLGKKELPFIREVVKTSRTGKDSVVLSPRIATDIMRKHSRNRISARSSHLERSRKLPEALDELLNPFLIKEPEKVLLQYYHDVFKRIEAARIFDGVDGNGKAVQDANALALIQEIEAAAGSSAARDATETYYRVVGDSQESAVLRNNLNMEDWKKNAIDFQNSFETITKLGMAQLPNMLQAANNGTLRVLNKTGNPIKSYTIALQGIAKSFTKEGREYAELTGAALETSLLEFISESTVAGKATETFLRGTGFLSVEKMQRIIGANMGRAYAQHLVRQKALIDAGKIKGLKAKKIMEQMDELNLPKNIKSIDDADMHRAGLIFSNEINFRNTPDKIPHGWNSFFGRMMRKFKSYALHQGQFVKQNVIKPAVRGNMAPLAHWATVGAGMGVSIDMLRQWLKGDSQDLDTMEQYMRGLTMIGGMGMMSDVVSQVYRDPGMAAISALGPFISDVAKLGQGVLKTLATAAPGEEFTTTPLAKAVVGTLVFPGKEVVKESLGQPLDKMERLKAKLQSMKGGSDRLDKLRKRLKELRGEQ